MILELLLQFILELILQLVAEIGVELGIEGLAILRKRERRHDFAVAFAGYAGLGAFIGWLSLFVLPRAFVRGLWWRRAGLVVMPLVAGYVMSLVGHLRQRRGGARTRLSTFFGGVGFALGMTVVRYIWAR